MDKDHKLAAPNNEELRTIDQIDDRSGLTTLYRNPGKQFEGDIMSSDERDKANNEKLAAISSGVSSSSLKLGLLLPYPFICGALLAISIYTFFTGINSGILMAILIIAGGFWVLTSYFAYAAIFKTFYKYGLRAGPYMIVMLISILAASQAIYAIVAERFSTQSALFNTALVSILVILYSIIATYILLTVWGNGHIKPIYKVLTAGGLVIVSGIFFATAYLL